jgi:class 3 adenylate cyclase
MPGGRGLVIIEGWGRGIQGSAQGTSACGHDHDAVQRHRGLEALLNRLGERYGEALSAQRELMRTAIVAWHGREMGTEGDSFYVVFESAADAVGCCLAAQQALAGHDWPDGAAVRVRMGLHSGEPVRHEDGYIGMDVHRAARIAATAHGGQVVLSDPTRLLAAPGLPAGVSGRDRSAGTGRRAAGCQPDHGGRGCGGRAAPGHARDDPPVRSRAPGGRR